MGLAQYETFDSARRREMGSVKCFYFEMWRKGFTIQNDPNLK